MNNVVLALDLGGTNARFAAVRQDGEILARMRTPTPKGGSTEQILDLISGKFTEMLAGLTDGLTPISVAAAVPATFGSQPGVLTKLPNLPALEGVNLSVVLKIRTGLPVVLENDATAATIGEHWLGASKDAQNVIGVTLGTGVGGGLIIEGKPFRGKDGTAGEIGHICVEPDGYPCGCGSRGCVEQYSSGTAIVRMANEAGLRVTTSLTVYELARDGDQRAGAVFAAMGRYLGIVLAGLANALNPDVIVIGGGVSAGWDMFIEHARREVSERAFREPAERVNIICASLGEDSGVLGAARVAFERVSQR